MNTGSIVDYYDDLYGTVLKSKIAHAEQVPDFIKKAQYLSPEQRSKLPDDAYAVVMVDRGVATRKYACVDKGNTALSAMYFIENHNKLPVEVQKVAAANLIEACEAYELEVPASLHKIASKPRAEIAKKKVKAADLSGSDVMSYSRNPNSKLASLYVDVTGKSAPTQTVKVAYARHCLEKHGSARFPIDSYGQVLDASRWFDEHSNALHPAERREYCVKLAARADELAVTVSDRIRKYAGQEFAPDGEVKIAVANRMQFWASDAPEHGALQGMMDKYAGVTPDVFCEALRQFDETHGLTQYWDEGVIDPWYSTYGFEKQAEWVWEQGADRLTEEQLKDGVLRSRALIAHKFGKDMAESLFESPIQVFGSLPLDSKRIIAHICSDPT